MKITTVLLLVSVSFLLIPTLALADIGPQATANMHITYQGEEITASRFNAIMLACHKHEYEPRDVEVSQLNIKNYDSERHCYWQPTVTVFGGECKNSQCQFRAFALMPKKFKLAVYLPSLDRVFISNPVSKKSLYSDYEVDLLSNGTINIKEVTPFLKSDVVRNVKPFIAALVVVLGVELSTGTLYLLFTKTPLKILVSIALGNLISLPLLWIVIPHLNIKHLWPVILIAQAFAISFESYFIYLLNRQRIALRRSFILSMLINLASCFIGGFLFLFFNLWI